MLLLRSKLLPRHLYHGVEAGYVVQGAMVQNPAIQIGTNVKLGHYRDASYLDILLRAAHVLKRRSAAMDVQRF
jgi:hypothetical protein